MRFVDARRTNPESLNLYFDDYRIAQFQATILSLCPRFEFKLDSDASDITAHIHSYL